MRAVSYVGGRNLELVSVEPIEPGPGEVRLRVEYVGICGTDLHIVHGDMDQRVRPPAIVGHEMSGRIVAVGAAVLRSIVPDVSRARPVGGRTRRRGG